MAWQLTDEQVQKFSLFLKKERAQRQFTQEQMGQFLGVSKPHYNQLENGKKNPTLNFIVKAAELLDTPDLPTMLLGEDYDGFGGGKETGSETSIVFTAFLNTRIHWTGGSEFWNQAQHVVMYPPLMTEFFEQMMSDTRFLAIPVSRDLVWWGFRENQIALAEPIFTEAALSSLGDGELLYYIEPLKKQQYFAVNWGLGLASPQVTSIQALLDFRMNERYAAENRDERFDPALLPVSLPRHLGDSGLYRIVAVVEPRPKIVGYPFQSPYAEKMARPLLSHWLKLGKDYARITEQLNTES